MKRPITSVLITLTAALALGTIACTEEEATTGLAALIEADFDFDTGSAIADKETTAGCPDKDAPECAGMFDSARGTWDQLTKHCTAYNTNGACVASTEFPASTADPLWIECEFPAHYMFPHNIPWLPASDCGCRIVSLNTGSYNGCLSHDCTGAVECGDDWR